MDKELAKRNMRMGIALTVLILLLTGSTFVWAGVYLHFIHG
ncbi:MAG: hypothetical protein ACP5OR_04515 [Candidatus Dormibacteria bacterium]